MKSSIVGCLGTLLILAASASFSNAVAGTPGPVYGWTTFDVPGAVGGTFPLVVNDLGTVVGSYYDANNSEHGFARSVGGRVVTIDVPGDGNQTEVRDINDEGVMIGYYTDAAGATHGFVRSVGGKFTTFDPPDSAGSTSPNAINFNGAIAGNYYDASGADHGFLRSRDGAITTVDAPNHPTAPTISTSCGHINDEGQVACKTVDSTYTFHEIIRSTSGTYTFVDAPGAGVGQFNGTFGSFLHGLTDLGKLAGIYYDNNSGAHGYVRNSQGAISTFDVPGAGATLGGGAGTYSSAINLLGTITGFTYDLDGVTGRGFVRLGNGTLIPFAAPGAPREGTYTQPSCINLAGEITGTYYDLDGAAHGFVAIVRQ